MKQSRYVLVLLVASLLPTLIPASAKAAMWDIPTGLAPGDTFRWVFITSADFDLTSTATDMLHYNNFVNTVADTAATTITGIEGKASIAEINWKVIGSTLGVNALTNIGTSSSEIFNPLGALVANGTADLFDGSISTPISITELGTQYDSFVWTGSNYNGTTSLYDPLQNSGYTIIGNSMMTNTYWIHDRSRYVDFSDPLPFYAISEELTVVPVPGAVLLGMLGLSVAGIKLRRREL